MEGKQQQPKGERQLGVPSELELSPQQLEFARVLGRLLAEAWDRKTEIESEKLKKPTIGS